VIGTLLKQEIESTFKVIPDRCTNDELIFVCPEPECADKSGNRALNLKTGKTFCWRCGKGKNNKGHFLAWARALGYQFTDEGNRNVPLEEVLYTPDSNTSIVPAIQEIALPEGFTAIQAKPKSAYARLITKMARRKNLYWDDFLEAEVGYTTDDPLWEPFAIFPVKEYQRVVYYQGRTYVDVPGETTKKFPSRNQVKYGASYWVYNIDAVRALHPPMVVLVESILNVLSLRWKLRELGWNKEIVPVCVFKHHLSQVQAVKLMRCPGIQEFCLLFDHDAIAKTWQSIGYIGNRVKLSVAEMPLVAGNKKCDPNDDVEAAIQAIEHRQLYTPANASGKLLSSRRPQLDITQRLIRS